jgi:plastocyanin
MRIPRSIRLTAAAALGAAVVVLPAAAASEGTPTIENEDPVHHWKPPAATIEAGGAVTFKNSSTTVPHGIHWISTPATPACDSSVPVGTTVGSSATSWSGDCKFAVAGTYTFYCTVHGSVMSGTITVTGPGGKEPPAETTPTGTTGTTPGAPPPGSGSGGVQGGGGQPGGSVPSASAALAALRLTVPRHGATVRGSLKIPPADAGGRLEIDLLAARSALVAGGPKAVRVGQLVRRGLVAGPLRFSIAPAGRGLRTLRRRGSLKVTMIVKLAPGAGGASSVSRRLTLHR